MKFIVLIGVLIISNVSTEMIKLNTYSPVGKRLYNYFPLTKDYMEFIVNADKDIAILICSQNNLIQPYYEILIDASIDKKPTSILRKAQDANYFNRVNTPQIIPKEHQLFWISLNHTEGSIEVGRGGSRPFLNFYDPNYVKLDYFAVGTGDGGTGEWLFNLDLVK